MVAQSPPFALQNASHSAQLFRLASFSSWRNTSGIVGPTDFAVSAQGTPNMSVLVGAGRAWIKGTQVASVSGGTWSPQGAYYGYNDAPVTLTVSSADPTNPRIDAVVAYATDAFYSGSTNTFTLGIVTGTPAASPVTPAVPSNGLLLGTLAVAANATSIVSGNIANAAGLLTVTRGGIQPVTSTDVTAGEYVDQYRGHPTLGLQRWNGSAWVPVAAGGRYYSNGTNSSTALTTTPTAPSGGASVSVPAGTYDVDMRAYFALSVGAAPIDISMGIYNGATQLFATDFNINTNAGANSQSHSDFARVTLASAGALTLQFWTSAVNGTQAVSSNTIRAVQVL